MIISCSFTEMTSRFFNRNVKGSQEVVDFVADRLREQRKNNELNLAGICEEVNLSLILWDTVDLFKFSCVKVTHVRNVILRSKDFANTKLHEPSWLGGLGIGLV